MWNCVEAPVGEIGERGWVLEGLELGLAAEVGNGS